VHMRACLASFVSLVLFAWTRPLWAAPMDPAIERLIDPSTAGCRTDSGAIALPSDGSDYIPCKPDHAAFRRLVAQYAFALAPTAMHSATTTGIGGFHVSLEAAYTDIDQSAEYWKLGTQGATDPSTNEASVINETPQGVLQLYSARLRKSFGYGFEIAAQTGFMPKTSLWSTGADVRLSLFEGFRRGIPGKIPDLAVGGGVRTVTGTPEFQLTIASMDVVLSKPFAINDAVVVTPFVGYQYLWIFADSNVVDFTPATDEETLCNYDGQALPGQTDAESTDQYTGSALCGPGGNSIDLENNRVFQRARMQRQRLLFGAEVRHESLLLGTELIVDFVRPSDAQRSDFNKAALSGMPRQWTAVLDLGLMF